MSKGNAMSKGNGLFLILLAVGIVVVGLLAISMVFGPIVSQVAVLW